MISETCSYISTRRPLPNGLWSSLDYLKKRLKRREIGFKPIPFLVISMYFCYFLSFSIGISFKFTIFAHGFRTCAFSKTYCSIDSQSPPETTSKLSILGLQPPKGAGFPYLKVACGEPRVVWRMSAPLA